MSDYLSRLAGTLLGFFRIGSLRLKDVGGALVLRNAGDTAHAGLEVAHLKVTTGAGSGKVLTSDADGAATWQAAGTVLDGAPITGTRTEGSQLVFNGATDWAFTDDPLLEGPQDDSTTGGEIETGQEMKVTVNGTKKLRITDITCVLERSRPWWVEIWNTSKTTKLAESDPWTLWSGGRTIHKFSLKASLDVEPGDVFYIRLWCDFSSRVCYLNSNTDIAGDTFTFSTAGCKTTSAFYCPAQITFIPGTAQGGWEYQPHTFLGLLDTPDAYTSQAGKVLTVNEGETGLEFVDAPTGEGGGGSVEVVDELSDEIYKVITATNTDPVDDLVSHHSFRALIFYSSNNTNGWVSASTTYTVPTGKKAYIIKADGGFMVRGDSGNRQARLWSVSGSTELLSRYAFQYGGVFWTGDISTPSKLTELSAGTEVRIDIWNGDSNKRAMGGYVIFREVDAATGLGGDETPGALTVTKKSMQTRTVIADVTLESAGTFDVDDIPQDYDHLEIMARLRSPDNGMSWAAMILNTDTTDGNYPTINTYWGTGSPGHSAGTGRGFGYCAPNDAPANSFSVSRAMLYDYASGKKKMVENHSGGLRESDTRYASDAWTEWQNTAAITRFRLTDSSGNNFAAGSRLTIIGIKTEDVVTNVTLS